MESHLLPKRIAYPLFWFTSVSAPASLSLNIIITVFIPVKARHNLFLAIETVVILCL